METLSGQAYGAKRYMKLGIYMQRSTILLGATGVPFVLVYIFCKPILLFLGQKEEVASAAALFVYGLIPQIFVYVAHFPMQKFLQAQSNLLPCAIICAAVLILHLWLTWLALFKWGWGLLGASLVVSFSWVIIVVAEFAYIVMSDRCKHTWTGFSRLAFSGLWDLFKLSTSSAEMLCFEILYLQVFVLIAGLLPNPEIALVSLSVW